MRSLQWRIIAIVALTILVASGITTSIMFDQLGSHSISGWDKRFEALGGLLLRIVPASWIESQMGKPNGLNELRSILLSISLNTVQLLITGILIVAAIRSSMRPLTRLSQAIKKRDAGETSPLPTDKVPREVYRLIVSFNSLLQRVQAATQAEHAFISNAAHELRTPLAALHAQAQIARYAQTMEQKNAALDKLLLVSHRSIRLTEQLLDLARLEGGLHATSHERVDLRSLAEHVINEFQMEADLREVSLHLSGSSCWVRCDIDEIGVLIRNLVDNAIKYGRRGGIVEVRCSLVIKEGRSAALLNVIDDGPGVPKAEQQMIFERFYRVQGTGVGGSGIGLSLVAGIAKFHNATIEVGEGEHGTGLSVEVFFPVDDPSSASRDKT